MKTENLPSRLILATSLVLSALAVGCGAAAVHTSDTPAQVTAKAEDALGACDLDGDFLHPLSQIELVESTGRLVRIVGYAPETNDLVLELDLNGQTQSRTFENEPDPSVRALEWGLSNFDTVRVAETSTGRIGFAVGQWADNHAAVIEPCSNHTVGGFFKTAFGDDNGANLLAFMTGDSETRASIVSELSSRHSQ